MGELKELQIQKGGETPSTGVEISPAHLSPIESVQTSTNTPEHTFVKTDQTIQRKIPEISVTRNPFGVAQTYKPNDPIHGHVGDGRTWLELIKSKTPGAELPY